MLHHWTLVTWYSASDDVMNVDLTKVHNLSGPIGVEGSEPGDCLVVDILDSESGNLLSVCFAIPWIDFSAF